MRYDVFCDFFSSKFETPYSCVQSEYFQGLRMLPPNLTAQIFVVLDMTFFFVLPKKSRELKFEVSQNLKFRTLQLGTVGELSEGANLASKSVCSFSFSFRDFFHVILK